MPKKETTAPVKSSVWREWWFQNYSPNAKLLYLYLITNPRTNPLGLFRASIKEICFETGIDDNKLNDCLNEINNQVSFHIEDNKSIIWFFVKNLLTQLGYENSPLHLKSLKNRLKNDDIPEIIEQDVLNRYQSIIPTDRIINTVALSKREVILLRDDFKCAYCGKNFEEIEDINLDHIIPLDAGGTDEYENLVSSCRRCNLEKLNLNPKDLEKTPQPTKFSKNDALKKLKQPTVLSKYRELFLRFK